MSVLLTYDTMWTSLWSSSNDCYDIIQIILIAYETLDHTYIGSKMGLISIPPLLRLWHIVDVYLYIWHWNGKYTKCGLVLVLLTGNWIVIWQSWKCVYVFFIYRQGFQLQSFWSVSWNVLGSLPACIAV